MPAGVKASELEVVNDAVAYGVSIMPADVAVGETFWKVTLVHHLTPTENRGNHHVYVDVLDEDGDRAYGTQVLLKWPSGSGIGVIDKPLNEPGTNFPIWKNQVVEVEVIGKPSDRVVGLHTAHPDEGAGNSLYHHSFLLVYQLAYNDGGGQANQGVIEGVVTGGARVFVLLQKDGRQVARTQVGEDGHYRFENVLPGIYTVSVEGTEVSVPGIEVSGDDVVVVDINLQGGGEPGPVLEHYVLFGPADAPGTRTNFLLAMDYVLRKQFVCGFRIEEALRARQVTIIGDVRAVSSADEERLVQAGVQVRRISGDSYAVEAILADLQ